MRDTEPIRKILTGVGVCVVTCLVALFSYMSAGWGLLDSAYMVVITVFGIGYGEVQPITDPLLKMQTMVLIVVGCLSGLYSVGGFIQLVAEGEIKRALGAQKMSRGIRRMKNHTIICGFGRVGKMLASELAAQKIPFVVIDNNQTRLAEASDLGIAVVVGDASCELILQKARIEYARSLASVIPNDAINVFITLTARGLNPDLEIIARAENPSTDHKLRRSGANHVVMPASIGALKMAQIINDHAATRGSTPADSLGKNLSAVEVSRGDELAESTVELAREVLCDLGSVVAIRRGDQCVVTELQEQMVLHDGDTVLLANRE